MLDRVQLAMRKEQLTIKLPVHGGTGVPMDVHQPISEEEERKMG